MLKTITQPYICILWCLIITSLATGRKMRLVGLLGNHLFACPNHVPSPKMKLSTGLGLITQANKQNNSTRKAPNPRIRLTHFEIISACFRTVLLVIEYSCICVYGYSVGLCHQNMLNKCIYHGHGYIFLQM